MLGLGRLLSYEIQELVRQIQDLKGVGIEYIPL